MFNIQYRRQIAIKNSRLGIPLLVGMDVIHGYETMFPIPLALSCSWDTEAMKKVGEVSAKEASADGINWTFSPMVDIALDARWGRISEGKGFGVQHDALDAQLLGDRVKIPFPCNQKGCQLTKTPYMAKRELYKISGHWDHYLDGMFVLGDPNDEEKECFALRPMTCPFQYQVFLNRQRSYRDLPMRLTETSTLFRNEDSGEMHGLIRVRQFTISEGHYIVRPEQLEDEFRGCLELAKYFLGTVGLLEDCTFRFSQWDPANPKNKYEGTPEQWEHAQAAMKTILEDLGIEYTIGIDEAAFYGPKLDIQYKNVFGKEDTLVTIQIDMLLAQRFGMEYVDVDGTKKNPYIIHRTSLGCYERTLAYLLEKYAGALPLWLSPEQVRILPVTDRAKEYGESIADKLTNMGIRVTVDNRNEKIGYKIRQAQLEKIPYFFIVGDKEVEDNTVSLRSRKDGDMGASPLNDVISKIVEENVSKAR